MHVLEFACSAQTIAIATLLSSPVGNLECKELTPFSIAAKVEIIATGSSDGNRTYDVRVLQQFQLESPTVPHNITIYTVNPTCCDACPNVSVGLVYLFSGHHRILEDGEVSWYLDDRSLVSEYAGSTGRKYDRKMTEWAANGLVHRRENNLCGQTVA